MGLSGEELAKQWIDRFQGQIYNFVRRMVGNDADAADLTQDIFAAAFGRRDALDRERDAAAYLYRIATHRVYRHLQSRSQRALREQGAAELRRSQEQGEDLLSREVQAEQQQQVQDSLDQLPEESRGLLLLHYYNGLSTAEIARVLEKPRSTVRDHLAQALDQLRSTLRNNGHVALLPVLEGVMRGTPPLELPAAVAQSLQLLATSASPLAVAAELSLGGLLMTQKLITLTCVVAVLASLGGFSVGRFIKPTADSPSQKDSGSIATSGDAAADRDVELQRLAEETQKQLRQSRQLLEERESRLAQLEAELMQLRQQLAAAASIPEGVIEDGAIDWGALAQVMNASLPLLLKMSEMDGPDARLSPADESQRMELQMALARAAASAREHSRYPVLEADILPKLMSSTLGTLLELDANQLTILENEAAALLAKHSSEYPETPLQAYLQRQAVFSELGERLQGNLVGDQHTRWDQLQRMWGDFSKGDNRVVSIGVGRGEPQDALYRELARHYQPHEEQQESFRAAAQEYTREARGILEEFNAVGEQASQLTPAQQQALRRALQDLQLRQEGALLAQLSDEQREMLQGTVPLLITFEDSGNLSINHSGDGGF